MAAKKSFYQDVYDVVRLVPEGKVSTYGTIANYLSLGSARMVGWALRDSFESGELVPAHRILNRKGELSGRNAFSPPSLMQALLESEGVEVEDNKVVDFDTHFWRPDDFED